MMEESTNPEEFSNAITIQVDVHHRHYPQLSGSIATTSHDCVNEPETTSDLPSIHRDYPKTAAQRMAEYRARKKKETPIVNHRKHKKSDAERAKEYRARKKAKIQSAGGNSDSNTSLGVSQVIEEDISEPATVQTSQDDPVDVDENTQTSIPDGSMDYSIDLFKCYTIISNVYCYLQREYISLESQLGAFCDVSVLSNTLERTAAATGVTQGEVEIALHATALQSDQPSKPEKTYSSTGVRRSCNILRNKRRSKALEEDKSEDSVRPAKRKATRGRPKKKTVPNKPSDEEQLPFPAPIQLQVHGVMRTECKIEPVDEPPSMEDDPLEAGSSSQCGKSEEIEIKTEPVDYESPDIKDDPLALEWSQTTLEEPSVPPDMTHTEVKSEHVDHDYANMYCGLSNNAKKSPDINPKSHLQ